MSPSRLGSWRFRMTSERMPSAQSHSGTPSSARIAQIMPRPQRTGFPVRAVASPRPGRSRLVVAVRASDPVVCVSQIVLGDLHGTIVCRQHQVLFEEHGPELPTRRGLQTAAEVLEALVGLTGIHDEAGGLHHPRVAFRVVKDEGWRTLIDPELRVALAADRLVGDALVLAHLLGHVQPHDPPRLQPIEVALRPDHDLHPVQTPEPRTVLEGAEGVVLLLHVIDIDLLQYRLGAGIPGSVGVVQSYRVVDPADQVPGDRVAADDEDLGVTLAADVVEAHELRAGIILRQLGANVKLHVLFSSSIYCTFLSAGSL